MECSQIPLGDLQDGADRSDVPCVQGPCQSIPPYRPKNVLIVSNMPCDAMHGMFDTVFLTVCINFVIQSRCSNPLVRICAKKSREYDSTPGQRYELSRMDVMACIPKKGKQHQMASQPYHLPGCGAFDRILQTQNFENSRCFPLSLRFQKVMVGLYTN